MFGDPVLKVEGFMINYDKEDWEDGKPPPIMPEDCLGAYVKGERFDRKEYAKLVIKNSPWF